MLGIILWCALFTFGGAVGARHTESPRLSILLLNNTTELYSKSGHILLNVGGAADVVLKQLAQYQCVVQLSIWRIVRGGVGAAIEGRGEVGGRG